MLFLRRVTGHSMEPVLREGMVILAIRSKSIDEGDIVVASVNDKEVVKLAKKVNSKQSYLAGNKPEHDIGWVDRRSIKGKLVWPRR